MSFRSSRSFTLTLTLDRFLLFVLIVIAVAPPPSLAIPTTERVWPISGTAEHSPQSSAFGPRQKHSEDNRYDFHRGIDIPTPRGTAAVSIDDGIVTIPGNHTGYSDGIIQVKYLDDEGGVFYANYIHMLNSIVELDQVVSKGDVLGHTGPEEGFEHLHFEIRKAKPYSANAVNPYGYLPYNNTVAISAVSEWVDSDGHYLLNLTVSTLEEELDFEGFAICGSDSNNAEVILSSFSFTEVNEAAGTDTDAVDDPIFGNVRISPHKFVSASTVYTISFTITLNSTVSSYVPLSVKVKDVYEGVVTAVLSDPPTLSPPSPVDTTSTIPTTESSQTAGGGMICPMTGRFAITTIVSSFSVLLCLSMMSL